MTRRLRACTLFGLIAMLLVIYPSLGQRNSIDTLLSQGVGNLHIKQDNLHKALSYMAEAYKIPIGLEVAQRGTTGPEIYISVKDWTLRDVINDLVEQDNRYEWKVDNGVVNVVPRVDRDVFVKDLLSTKVQAFTIKKGTSLFDIRGRLVDLPEVKAKLAEAKIVPNTTGYFNADFVNAGDEFSLSVSGSTLREILNEIVRNSETKYWIVNRVGQNGDELILNF